jgi:uncharacterized protein
MNERTERHNPWEMLALHVLPGLLITLFYFLAAPILIGAGYPPLMAVFLAILLILIPFELGFLYYQGKKRNGRYSLEGIVLFRERIPTWQMVLLIAALFAWGGLVFTSMTNVDNYFVQNWFAWFPAWALPDNMTGDPGQISKSAMGITLIAGFILNGIAGPVVEELYFRGYLLPRIPAARWWAPLINVLLFSLYHFFSPWQNITRILAMLPIVYAVAWKRNIYISMWTHCLMNLAGMLGMLSLLFAG